MKPRLYKDEGLWYCDLDPLNVNGGAVGIGYTPQQAYADWLDMRENHAQKVCA